MGPPRGFQRGTADTSSGVPEEFAPTPRAPRIRRSGVRTEPMGGRRTGILLDDPPAGNGTVDPPGTPAGPPRLTPARRRLLAVAAAVLVLVVTAVLFYRWGAGGPSGNAAPAPSPSPSASPSGPPTTAEIYQAVAPSIVAIDAVRPDGEFTGTGLVVNADATIVTALHVVRGATSVRVTFADGTVSPAAIVDADPSIDIAVLGPEQLPSLVVPAVLGSAGRLAVGDGVVAIGNPLGLTASTTTGVVSGLNRAATEPDGTQLAGLIQFDAAVNPGSSGGPLLDGDGQTVGIVVALANPTTAGTFIGIGFAVPIGTALAAGGGSRAPQQ